MRVRDVMSNPLITVSPDKRLKEVAELLVTHRISAVPVVEDGELAGIVARRDLLEVLARRDEDIARELEALLARDVPGVVAVRLDEE